jgi:4-oxalocrotonate tautomerase
MEEKMPFITVHMWPGRTAEVKARIISSVTEAVNQAAGIPREAIHVVILEVPQENWGTAGVPLSQSRPANPQP